MELCVLMPEAFSLSNDTSDKSPYFVVSRQQIEKDTKFTSFDGDFRLGKVGFK